MLEIIDLSKKFKTKNVLENISLALEFGHVYGLLGNNGVGKTTLIKLIFQEYSIDRGKVKFNGVDLKNVDFRDWYFFVENNELPKNMKVKQYIDMIATMSGISLEVRKKRIIELSNFLDMTPFFKNKISDLSTGQQKLLSLYNCFLVKPKIIFFDEPTANLDIQNKEIILKAIKQLANQGTLIVLITHLIEEVKDLLTDIIIMDHGQITYNQSFNHQEDIKTIFQKHTTVLKDNKNQIQEYLNDTNK